MLSHWATFARRVSPSKTMASVCCARFIMRSNRLLARIFWNKLHVLICRWIKHVCTFQYREHPCHTRDLANHSLLSKRLRRSAHRRLYCTTITMFREYFISSLLACRPLWSYWSLCELIVIAYHFCTKKRFFSLWFYLHTYLLPIPSTKQGMHVKRWLEQAKFLSKLIIN